MHDPVGAPQVGVPGEPAPACRAFDRLFRAGRYWIPHWHLAAHRIAYWDVFGRPATKPRYGRGIPETWWYDRDKAAKLDLTAGWSLFGKPLFLRSPSGTRELSDDVRTELGKRFGTGNSLAETENGLCRIKCPFPIEILPNRVSPRWQRRCGQPLW